MSLGDLTLSGSSNKQLGADSDRLWQTLKGGCNFRIVTFGLFFCNDLDSLTHVNVESLIVSHVADSYIWAWRVQHH